MAKPRENGGPHDFLSDKPMGFLLNDPQRFPHKNGGGTPSSPIFDGYPLVN